MELEVKLGGVEVEVKGLRGLATLAGITLLAAAILRELGLPPAQRTWHGSVLGCVPYDFRPPTTERIRDAFWSSSNESLFTPHVFGVGWSVNARAVARRLGLVA